MIPAVVVALMAAVLLLVDPWLAGAPWWQAPEGVGTLAGPLLVWLGVCLALAVVGVLWCRTWEAVLAAATGVMVATFGAYVLARPTLLAVFPEAGPFMVTLVLGGLAIPVWCIALMAVIVRPALHRILERHAAQQRRR